MRRLMLICTLFLGAAAGAMAQAPYPDRPIRVVMPLAAGSAVDVVFRIVAELVERTLGQRLVIENMTGASGIVGMRAGARAAPDGYTL
ncbi:MAG: hypothetical protein JWO26_1262, partial [Rhodospirillales bacterium]|nr:hypothetical protein [Rhodospirillales bacterium]